MCSIWVGGALHMRSIQGNVLKVLNVKGETVATLMKVLRHQGRLSALHDVRPDILAELRQTAVTLGTEASAAIEGEGVPTGRVQAIVMRNERPQGRSEEIVAGYQEALKWIHEKHADMDVTEDTIQNLHRKLYGHTTDPSGQYRATRADIVRREPDGTEEVVFTGTPPSLIAGQMKQLCREYAIQVQDPLVDPFLLMAGFLLDFLCIHPFADGNGRVSRLLNTLLSYKADLTVVRYVSLERQIYATKADYYWSLTRSSQDWHRGAHHWDFWLDHLARLYLAAYEHFEVKLEEMRHGSKSHRIRQAVANAPTRFTKRDIINACVGISEPLVNRVIGELKAEKTIQTVGRGPKAHYEKIDSLNPL